MRLTLIVYSFFLMWGCSQEDHSSTESGKSASPEFIHFEHLKTVSPDGTIPNVKSKMIRYFKSYYGPKFAKTIKVYPNSWNAVDDMMATLAVTKITFNPKNTQEFYFCTGEGFFNADAARGAGLWHSNDAGDTWNQLPSTDNDTFNYCQDMMVHPVTEDLYVCTRGFGVMRSQDKGKTWKPVLNAAIGSSGNNASDMELTKDNEIWVSMGMFNQDGLYYSKTGDEGDWEKRMNGMPSNDYHRIEFATAPSNDSVLYAVPTGSSNRRIIGIYRTRDKGLNWTKVESPGGDRNYARVQGWYDLIIAVDPNDENVVVTGGLNIWRSKDAGDSWQLLTKGNRHEEGDPQYVHVDQHEITFLNSDTILFGNDGGVYRCDEFTKDTPVIYNINQNYNVTQYYSGAIYPGDDHRVFGGTQDNGTYVSTGEGVSNFEKMSWADGSYCNVDHINGEAAFTTTQYRRIYRFYKGKIDTLTNAKLVNDNTLFINPIEMDPNDPKIVYQASNIGLWRLNNAFTQDSSDWKKATISFGGISAIGISKSEPNLVVFGRTNGGPVFKIENANTTDDQYFPVSIDRSGQLPNGYHSCVAINPTDANHIIVTFTNYGIESVWETRDGLSDEPTWTSVEGDLMDMPVRWALFHPENPDGLYLATEFGVWFTDKLDGANTIWKPTIESLANLRIDMIRTRAGDGTVLAATHGRGLWTGKVQEDFTIQWEERGPSNVGGRTRTIIYDPNDPSHKKIWAGSVSGGLWTVNNYDSIEHYYEKEIVEEDQPTKFKVYPNPANRNQDLTIDLADRVTKHVTIKIYTVKGQLINELNQSLNDEFRITHDLSALQQGMYILVIEGLGEEVAEKVMVVND